MIVTHTAEAPTVRRSAGPAVVVGTRGIDESFAAVEWADAIAGSLGSPLVVVDACEPSESDTTAVEDETRCRDIAAHLRRRLAGVGVTPDVVCCELGEPGAVLLDASSGAAALVIGSHLGKPGRRFGHGHLAHDLARLVDCPLVVVPRGHPDHPERIVVGVDGRQGDGMVLGWADTMAAAFGCPVTAVHVADPLASMFVSVLSDPVERTAARAAAAHDVELVHRVAENVVAELIDVAVTRSAGMIVVGTEQPHGVLGPILGSVTGRLLDQVDIGVVVVPHPDEAA